MLELGTDGLLQEFTPEEIAMLKERWAGVDIFKDVFDNLGMIGQLLTLKDKATSKLYIAVNTHLYHSPKAPHVKVLQTHMIMKALERLLAEIPEAVPIFCGDLNSSFPAEVVVDYITRGDMPADHRDWRNGPFFTWTNRECEGADRSTVKGPLGIPLHHGVKNLEHVPEEGYTNAVCGWAGIIDHIFYDRRHLRPVWSLPILSKADIESCNGALPYKSYGSDHCMLTTEFQTLL
ncbi:carbon catabolite repressor protein, putative [Perkinsus marinus ATCC 50983]|uniref:Carbon catabolite repressor protein, putative n=1 Tax=Perkinsus marinus (strain ATCC 50983 / TXsc) TaxID=423536 RepID=C5L7U2_PERM5|nr:carbon catabolite repressor protein, putative [Perkinsus marinus ATCC 50983]EER07201.1 carbon catabolite repressor protein, putative [Perkinsus marinus ATCC 50983]|eukprot:XP_002775385.1 carbon catabolite repressor protein, putative [Perkinsus marinus ATCC 50983]